jgi:hypothetical protein
MNVNTQSMPLAVVSTLAGARSLVPRVWCQLDSPLQAQLAQCWAKLVHRMYRAPTAGPGGEYGRVK